MFYFVVCLLFLFLLQILDVWDLLLIEFGLIIFFICYLCARFWWCVGSGFGVLVVFVLTLSLLSWFLLGSGYLRCKSLFIGVFGPCQLMLLKDSKKFADLYFAMPAFLSEHRVPVFRLLGWNSASLFWGFGPKKACFALKPLYKLCFSKFGPGNFGFSSMPWPGTGIAATFNNGPSMLYDIDGPLIPLPEGHFCQEGCHEKRGEKHQIRGENGFWSSELSASHGIKGLIKLPRIWPKQRCHQHAYMHMHMHIYIYIYIYACCEVINWSKFGRFNGY